MKLIILLLVLFVSLSFVPLVSAIQIGISPAEIIINANTGEKVCREIVLFASFNIVLIGEDRWSRQGGKELRNYNLEASEFGISMNYSKRVRVEDNRKLEVCLIGEKTGRYYGAIIFQGEGNTAGVGSWITLEMGGGKEAENNREEEKLVYLTGNVVETQGIESRSQIIILISSFILLTLGLIFLVWLKKWGAGKK